MPLNWRNECEGCGLTEDPLGCIGVCDDLYHRVDGVGRFIGPGWTSFIRTEISPAACRESESPAPWISRSEHSQSGWDADNSPGSELSMLPGVIHVNEAVSCPVGKGLPKYASPFLPLGAETAGESLGQQLGETQGAKICYNNT